MIKSANLTGGATALVTLILKDKIYIANAGDSRAVLLRDENTLRITTDHKPDIPEEEERIIKSGGMVTKVSNKQGKTISRVNGMLAVSRALGDVFLQPFVSAEPQIHQIDLSENNRVIILACDGLWDVVNDDEATALAMEEDSPEYSAIKLRDTALSKGSADNISVIVIRFPTSTVRKTSNVEPSPKAPPFVGGCKV
jgi:protein phosphatase 1L